VTKKGIGELGAKLLSNLNESNKSIFTVEDAAHVLGRKKPAVGKLLHDLAKNEWVMRLSRSKYLILPLEAGFEPKFTEHEFVIASHLVHPYYIGYWSALNYYGFTEQVPRTVFVATPKRKRDVSISGVGYKFIALSKKKFFGYEKVWIGPNSVVLSSKEKTIIDCLDHPEYCGELAEAAKGLWNGREEISFAKLLEHGKRIGSNAVLKRLGYLLELFELEPRLAGRINKMVSRSYSPLDPTKPKKGRYDSKWKLLLNVSEKDLTEWREH
jgi:predicted transcriptional regulator of viral defense system